MFVVIHNNNNKLLMTRAGLVTVMLAVGQHLSKSLMERTWQQLSAPRLSTSSATTGGRHSVHSTRLRRQLRPSSLFESKKRSDLPDHHCHHWLSLCVTSQHHSITASHQPTTICLSDCTHQNKGQGGGEGGRVVWGGKRNTLITVTCWNDPPVPILYCSACCMCIVTGISKAYRETE